MRNEIIEVYFAYFTPTEEELKMRELVKKYHELCEAFDQKVCRLKNDRGVAIPTDDWELGQINKNAIEVRKKVFSGYTLTEIQEAFFRYSKYYT